MIKLQKRTMYVVKEKVKMDLIRTLGALKVPRKIQEFLQTSRENLIKTMKQTKRMNTNHALFHDRHFTTHKTNHSTLISMKIDIKLKKRTMLDKKTINLRSLSLI